MHPIQVFSIYLLLLYILILPMFVYQDLIKDHKKVFKVILFIIGFPIIVLEKVEGFLKRGFDL